MPTLLDDPLIKNILSLVGGAGLTGLIAVWLKRRTESEHVEQSKDAVAFSEMRQTIADLRGEIRELRGKIASLESDRDGLRTKYDNEFTRLVKERDDERHEKQNLRQERIAHLETIRMQAVEIVHMHDTYGERIADLEREVLSLGGKLNGHAKPSA